MKKGGIVKMETRPEEKMKKERKDNLQYHNDEHQKATQGVYTTLLQPNCWCGGGGRAVGVRMCVCACVCISILIT